jgi:dolichyl-phosphate beta-glucosyltransferase
MAAAPYYSIIIPVYNEAKRLKPALQQLDHYVATLKHSYEILFVDDGSSDKSVAILQEYVSSHNARRLLQLSQNLGKGGAVRQGMLHAEGNLRAFIDVDMATPPTELNKLFTALELGADIAIGSRINEHGVDLRLAGRKPQSLGRRILGKLFRLVATRPFLGNIRDSQCGAKAFTAAAATQIFPLQQVNRWAFDIEILYLAKKLGFKIAEVPVDWSAQDDSKLQPSFSLALTTIKELGSIWLIHR